MKILEISNFLLFGDIWNEILSEYYREAISKLNIFYLLFNENIVHRICLRMVRTITMMVRKETGLAKLVMVLILVRLVLQMEKIALRIVIMI